MQAYISPINVLDLSVSYVTNRILSKQLERKLKFSIKGHKEVLDTLTTLVRKDVGREMSNTKCVVVQNR